MSQEPAFFDVVRGQRACRSFSDDRVSDETVERVLDAATFAPSAENRQPWVFVVVREAATRDRIGALTRRAWEGGAREHSRPRLPATLFSDVDRGATSGLGSAPVLVVVAADTGRCHPTTVASSTFPAIQNLLLAAQALGLGAALTTLAVAYSAELQAILELPEHVQPVAVVPLGFPAEPLGRPRRDPFAEHTHRDRYGHGW